MSDIKSESMIRAKDNVPANTKPARKTGKVNKEVSNGGKIWRENQVSLDVCQQQV